MLLIRCKCHKFFSERKEICPNCGTDWKAKGAGAKFYARFSLYGKIRVARLKAKNWHFAHTELGNLDPEKWWEEKQRKEKEEKVKIPTFSGAIDDYLEWCRLQGSRGRGPNRDSTRVSKRNSLENHLNPHLGKKQIDAITDRDVFVFIREEEGRRQPESINLDLRYLKNFFTWAIDRGYRLDSPMRKIVFLEEKGPRVELRFKDFEIRQLTAALSNEKIPAHKRNIVRMLLMTGLSAYSEVARARWDWYDAETETLTIPAGQTKGKRPIRKVLSARLANLLNEMLNTKDPESPYIFPNPVTKEPYRDLRKLVRTVCRDAGIARWEEVSPKWFRHNYLSWGGALGLPAERLQDSVGHANASTTLHYTHLYDDEKRKVEDEICERFFETSEQNSERAPKKKGDQEMLAA